MRRMGSGLMAGALAAGMVMLAPTAAHAADVRVYSTDRIAVAVYDDSENSIMICDLRDGDGIGARGGATGYWGAEDIVYNGCKVVRRGISEGSRIELFITNWVVGPDGQRTSTGYAHHHFYDTP